MDRWAGVCRLSLLLFFIRMTTFQSLVNKFAHALFRKGIISKDEYCCQLDMKVKEATRIISQEFFVSTEQTKTLDVGDFFIHTFTGKMYKKIEGSAIPVEEHEVVGTDIWVLVATLAGTPGPPGADGADGADGTNGTNGTMTINADTRVTFTDWVLSTPGLAQVFRFLSDRFVVKHKVEVIADFPEIILNAKDQTTNAQQPSFSVVAELDSGDGGLVIGFNTTYQGVPTTVMSFGQLSKTIEFQGGGLRPPVKDTAQLSALAGSAPEGTLAYNIQTHKMQVRTNVAWVDLH